MRAAEIERRRTKMRQLFDAVDDDAEFLKHRDQVYADRDERIPEAHELLERLASTLDLELFREAIGAA